MNTATTFKFVELSDEAKERARDWYREGNSQDWEPNCDDYTSALQMLGFEVATETVHLMNGKVRVQSSFGYSIGYCQGDYANFSGRWCASHLRLDRLQADRPTDETLLGIGARLMGIFLRHPDAVCDFSSPSAHAVYVNWAYADGRGPSDTLAADDEKLEADLKDIIKDLFSWLYHQMRDELDFINSNENVDEAMDIYEFDEDGNVA